jgi:23S rRNA (cytosine1962-C5)-methyltransferase
MNVENKQAQPSIEILIADGWKDYELLDSGNGFKLERFGPYTFIRPEHQAVWLPALNERDWNNAQGRFVSSNEESGGHWSFRTQVPETWSMRYGGMTFRAKPSNSRHLGVFPEQAAHWDWIGKHVEEAGKEVKVLNLFGYTGMATLAAAKAGASVTHVDASKKAIGQARENQSLSNLENAPIRWIMDDALKFVRREARRGSLYEGIILDPPKFGRGPKGEVWEFFDMLPVLLREIRPILSENLLFLVITAYAIRSSALTLYYAMDELTKGITGTISAGELVAREQSAGRYISLAIYARWTGLVTPEYPGGRLV